MRTLNRSKRGRHLGVESLETRQVLSTLFVSPTGSDTAKGTAAAPLRTLQRAANLAVAGDTVDVQAGNYAGFVMGWDTPKSGAPGAPITFKGEPGAVINVRNNKTPDGIDLESSSWITIEGFKIQGMPRAGVRSSHGDHVVIDDNTIDASGYWGIFTSFDSNLTVNGNTSTNAVRQHGIYVSNSAVNPTITNNVIYGNAQNGIHLNGDVSQGGTGIVTGALVQGNIIHDNGRLGGSAINCDGVQNSIIRDNLLYNNHASGISLYRIDGGGPSTNNLVIGNTIVNASDAKYPINIQNGSTGTQVFDNILLTLNTSKASSYCVSSDSLPGLVADNNAVMGLSAWRTQSKGQDAHSFETTPAKIGFVNAAAADYHLAAGSLAIDAGTVLEMAPLAAPIRLAVATRDLGGSARVQGANVDLGAFESTPVVKTSTPPPPTGIVTLALRSPSQTMTTTPSNTGTRTPFLASSGG